NISSPNTPGLRNMQAREQLGELLSRVVAARAAASVQPPIFLKIAPDLVEAELEDIAAEVIEKKIDGVVVSNTTLARVGLRSASPQTALEKIRAGADLVQLYTGMIYAGPALPGRIVAGMARFVERERLGSIQDLRDSACERWASKPIS
ncbi:MAG: dihydroorotate dehydrogenase (quinone), partial [Mesorhizobium sp.]